MLSERVQRVLVRPEATVRDAMKSMDESGDRVVLVADQDGVLLGVMTDGDVRRFVLSGRALDEPVGTAMNASPITIGSAESVDEARRHLEEKRIECVPVIDETGHLTDVVWWRDLFEKHRVEPEQLGLPVVIMAGGQGSRLLPFTNILPKPLVPLGEKTILEMIMERFAVFGCAPFYVTVNYKADLIRAYLADVNLPWEIQYVQENQPLGTAGSLSLLKGAISSTFLLTNSDIVVDADYGDIVRHHHESGNLITLVTSMRHVTVPYGVCEAGENGSLVRINEKPHFDYLVSTGLYVVEPQVIDDIADDTMVHVTEVINHYLDSDKPVGVYPVSEGSWLDIGEFTSLDNAMKRLGTL